LTSSMTRGELEGRMDFHALANLVPLLTGEKFQGLVENVRANGLREEIVLYEGKILDGRIRHLACIEAEVEPRFRTFGDRASDGDDPRAFVISLNIMRRHLGESQRAMMAARLANLDEGRPSKTTAIAGVSQGEAAELCNVSVDSIGRAKKVLNSAIPEIVAAVDSGQVTVSTGASLAQQPAPIQTSVIERLTADPELNPAALVKQAKILQARAAYEAKADKGANVGDLVAMAEAGQKFPVIYADPPWEFKVYAGKGKQRSAERYYDTSSVEAIKALPVGKLAAKDCVLCMWAVSPELPGALEVIKAWGFEYKTIGFGWVKQNRGGKGLFTGMGYWTRANLECCLLAARGAPMRLAMDVHQVVTAPIGEHSAKPQEVRSRIQRLLAGPYLELFAREATPGWTSWGNELARLAAEPRAYGE
jgi:N6-adenosine-specific RNA methylase IME4